MGRGLYVGARRPSRYGTKPLFVSIRSSFVFGCRRILSGLHIRRSVTCAPHGTFPSHHLLPPRDVMRHTCTPAHLTLTISSPISSPSPLAMRPDPSHVDPTDYISLSPSRLTVRTRCAAARLLCRVVLPRAGVHEVRGGVRNDPVSPPLHQLRQGVRPRALQPMGSSAPPRLRAGKACAQV